MTKECTESVCAHLTPRAFGVLTFKEHDSFSQPAIPALAALIFFSVSGGPFGMEECVLAGGPLVTMIGLAVLPVLWSVPEALITAELAPAFPESMGSAAWCEAAFGPFGVGWAVGGEVESCKNTQIYHEMHTSVPEKAQYTHMLLLLAK
jgi:hypothetical protein